MYTKYKSATTHSEIKSKSKNKTKISITKPQSNKIKKTQTLLIKTFHTRTVLSDDGKQKPGVKNTNTPIHRVSCTQPKTFITLSQAKTTSNTYK